LCAPRVAAKEEFEYRVELTLKPPLFMNVAAMLVLAGDFQRFEPKLTFQLRADLNWRKVA
jgi:hypothetical protein